MCVYVYVVCPSMCVCWWVGGCLGGWVVGGYVSVWSVRYVCKCVVCIFVYVCCVGMCVCV